MTYKINEAESVAVDLDYYWNEDMTSCPRGVKVQLLGMGGLATHGIYNGAAFWVGWTPLPRKRKEKRDGV